jgi:hypothetical protein
MMTTTSASAGCMLCEPQVADAYFRRVRLWEDALWRLSAVMQGPIPGFAHLEPRRHIPFISDLGGPARIQIFSTLLKKDSPRA